MYAIRSTIGCAALLTMLAGCQPPDQSAAAADAVRAADAAWSRAFAAKDADGFASYLAADVRALAPNTPLVTGPADFRAVIETFFALPGFAGGWEVTDAQGAQSGELAYTTGTYQLSWNDSTGTAINDSGKYATVWRKQADGTWKAVLDAFNSDLPPQ